MAHLCWCIAIVALIVYCMLELYRDYVLTYNTPMVQILNVSEYIFNVVNCVLIIVGCNYQRQWQSIYLQQINALDIKLNYSAVEANADLNCFLRTALMISGFFMLCVFSIIAMYHQTNYFGLFISVWAYVVANIIISLAILQYLVLIFIVQQRYKRLARGLGKLSSTKPVRRILTTDELLRNTFMGDLQNVGRRRYSPHKGYPDSIKRRIEVLRTCFVDLNILEKNISQSFGVFLVSMVTSTFFILTTQLYVFYTLTQIEVGLLNLAYSAAWLMLHFVKVFSMLFMSSGVVQEVKYMNRL